MATAGTPAPPRHNPTHTPRAPPHHTGRYQIKCAKAPICVCTGIAPVPAISSSSPDICPRRISAPRLAGRRIQHPLNSPLVTIDRSAASSPVYRQQCLPFFSARERGRLEAGAHTQQLHSHTSLHCEIPHTSSHQERTISFVYSIYSKSIEVAAFT